MRVGRRRNVLRVMLSASYIIRHERSALTDARGGIYAASAPLPSPARRLPWLLCLALEPCEESLIVILALSVESRQLA